MGYMAAAPLIPSALALAIAVYALLASLCAGAAPAPAAAASVGVLSPLLAPENDDEDEPEDSVKAGAGRRMEAVIPFPRVHLTLISLVTAVRIGWIAWNLSEQWPMMTVDLVSGVVELSAWVVSLAILIVEVYSFTHDRSQTQLIPFSHVQIAFHLLSLGTSIYLSILAQPTSLAGYLPIVTSILLLVIFLHLFSVVDDVIEAAHDAFYTSKGLLVPSRERTWNPLSRMYFSWMNPLMRLGEKRPLRLRDVPDLDEYDRAENCVRRFQGIRGDDARGKYKNLITTLFMLELPSTAFQVILGVFGALLSTVGPLLLFTLLEKIQNPKATSAEAFTVVLLLALNTAARSMFDGHAWHIARHVGIRMKAILVNEIYVKSLRRVTKVRESPSGGAKTPKEKQEEEDEEEKFSSSSVGKIVTLMSADTEKVKDTMPFVTDSVLSLLQICAAVTALLFVVGWPGLVGVFVMVAAMPITYRISTWVDEIFERLSDATDKRTTAINETLQGIRVIKYFAWEDNFLTKIFKTRHHELNRLFYYYAQSFIQNLTLLLLPNLVSYFTLLAITQWQGRTLDAQLAFTCLALFDSIKDPLAQLPDQIVEVYQLRVALNRISRFLDEEEFEHLQPGFWEPSDQGLGDPEVGFRNGVFRWFVSSKSERMREENSKLSPSIASTSIKPHSTHSPLLSPQPTYGTLNPPTQPPSPTFTLHNLTLTFPPGKLTAICGPTGSGKSSLIQALLGEMRRMEGRAFLPSLGGRGGVAYVAQTSWLQNATIRENILFGEMFEERRYAGVLRACCLERDLRTFESGDLTEIGEKGINLSGGQKQRVSLARAIYSRATHILLDDPLSAVDAPTARHLLHKAILNLLQTRTVLLVTHATHLVLPVADFVVVMDSGRCVASGTVREVMANPDVGRLVSFEKGDGCDAEEGEDEGEVDDTPADFSNGKASVRLVEDEGMAAGSVKLSVYTSYLSAAGGVPFLMAVGFVLVAGRVTNVASSYWIREWTKGRGTSGGHEGRGIWMTAVAETYALGVAIGSGGVGLGESLGRNTSLVDTALYKFGEGGTSKSDALYFANVYAVLSFSWVLLYLSVIVVRSFGAYRASKYYHAKLVERILYAPMRFFDTTPIGRILSRAGKDIN
ncbi:hypothetical protein HDU67_009299, partial [Dinochytrium kinnereticum]